MVLQASELSCTPLGSKVFLETNGFGKDDEVQRAETASSKDSVTRINSARTSKSVGTVVQRLEPPKACVRAISEECTSSASDRCQGSGMPDVTRAVLPSASNKVHLTGQKASCHLRVEKLSAATSKERSRSSQSKQNRGNVLDDAQSKHEKKPANKRRSLPSASSADLCLPKSIPPNSLAVPSCEGIAMQIKAHESNKAEVLPSAQAVPEARDALIEGQLEDVSASRLPEVPSRDSVCTSPDLPQDSGSLSRVCSTAVGLIAPQTEGGLHVGAMPAPDFNFERKQRSRSGKRGRAAQGPGLTMPETPLQQRPNKLSSTAKKQTPQWRCNPGDYHYRPPGASLESEGEDVRAVRALRTIAQPDLDELRQRSSHVSRDLATLPPVGSLSTTPSRSTRSQPQDFSALWENFYPKIVPAKRMRGFNLTSAINKSQEAGQDKQCRLTRLSYSLAKKPLPIQQNSPEGDELRARVQQSICDHKISREAMVNYFTNDTSCKSGQLSETAERLGNCGLAKILSASNPEAPQSRPDGELRLPCEQMTPEFLKTNLREWQQALSQGDPSLSSVRKRQQEDDANVWEHFDDSSNAEESALVCLAKFLQP